MDDLRVDPIELMALLGPDCNVPVERLEQLCEAFDRALQEALRYAAAEAKRRMRLHELKYHTAMACFGEVFDPDVGTDEWRRLRAN